MINKKKHIGKIKYKALRAEEKKLKPFFLNKTTTTTTTTTKSKKRQLPQDLQSVGRLFIFVKHCQIEICKNPWARFSKVVNLK